MTLAETSPTPTPTSPDEHLLEQVMACDAFVHSSSVRDRIDTTDPRSAEADDRGRSRLLLLLTMLEAADTTAGASQGESAARGQQAPPEKRLLLGRFEVIEEIGAGGFGFVVRARDIMLGREVALKMPLPERVLGPGDVRRFLKEAQAAARLDHPHIVRVHDAGELGPLGYYIASEYCAGPNLRRWLQGQNEPVPGRLAARWLADLADAVQHAHDRGILHRDIKPDNVMLAGASGPHEFIPRLTDFGLAKLLEEPGDETRSGARMGTPHYMAPEQAAGLKSEIGPATDVYGLGATLYELLTGRPPFRGENDAGTLRLVLDEEPVAPRTLRQGLPRDLETICQKSLRKEPARRYTTAAGLRADLMRFLAGKPIAGRPPSRWERARGLARRRPGYAALLTLAAITVLGTIGGVATWTNWLQWHNRLLKAAVARADEQTREAETQRQIAQEQAALAEGHLHAERLRRAHQALEAHQVELAQDILHDDQPGPHEVDHRGFGWRYLWRQATRDVRQLWGHQGRLLGSAVSPDGRSLATVDLAGNVLIWGPAEGASLDRPSAAFSTSYSPINTTQFSQDGRYLAAGLTRFPGRRQGIDVFDRSQGRCLVHVELHAGEGIFNLAFDDRRQVLVITQHEPAGYTLRFHDLTNPSATPPARFLGTPTIAAFLSPDARIVGVQQQGGIVLSDRETGQVLVHLADPPAQPLGLVEFSTDGRFVAALSEHEIMVWELERGRRIGRHAVEGGCDFFALSSHGRYIGWGEENGRLATLETASGRVREIHAASTKQKLRGHGLSFSSDERLLAVTTDGAPGGPSVPVVWDLERGRKTSKFPGRNDGGSAIFLPGGHDVLVTSPSGPRIWRLEPPAEPAALGGHAVEAWAVAFSPDGKVLATGSDDTGERQTIKLWDPASSKPLAGWKGQTATVATLAFSPDGQILASGSLDSGQPGNPNLVLWDGGSHARLAILAGHAGGVRAVAFSPDGRWLASASDDGTARLWDVATRTTRAVLTGHTLRVNALAFSPDGRWLATGSCDATVRLWHVDTGQTGAILQDVGNVNAVAFAPEGLMLASASDNGEIRLWNPATGNHLRTIRGEAGGLRCLIFTPDGRAIAAAGKGQTIHLWDIATDQEILGLDGHKAAINALAFSPDGSMLASCSHDGAVRLWHASPTDSPAKP